MMTKSNKDEVRVLQTISGLIVHSGGPSFSTSSLMEGLRKIGTNVDLLTVRPASPSDVNLGKGCPWLKEVANDYCRPFFFSRNAQLFLAEQDYDLFHCNGLWMGINHETCSIARRRNLPYVISPHGMLYPSALRVHAWKKMMLRTLWYNRDILQATCLHATCRQELEHCRNFGYRGPIAVIPNPVRIPQAAEWKEEAAGENDCRRIGFLGRLHPIKKVEHLLYALALLTDEERKKIQLQIMGSGDSRYTHFLKTEAMRLCIEKEVEFVGFVEGEEKFRMLSALSALMVPSEQENFGMIVPEALVCGTPVYASLGTPWSDLGLRHCGWWRDNKPETIAQTIREIIGLPNSVLKEMGSNGRKRVEEKYERRKVAQMTKQLYEWVVKDRLAPEFRPEFVDVFRGLL